MSGLARLLKSAGCKVSGSELNPGENTEALEQIGIKILTGHKPENVDGASVVVFSSAISEENSELARARSLGIRVVHRSDLLGLFAKHHLSVGVSGSHGKTTTTAMITYLLDLYGKSPSFAVGGIDSNFGSNARLTDGEIFVYEADESDASFLKTKPDIAVVTNIGKEHLNNYGCFEACIESFYQFMSEVPFYGYLIASFDDLQVRNLLKRVSNKVRCITFGLEPGAQVRASSLVHDSFGSTYDLEVDVPSLGAKFTQPKINLPAFGLHNVANSLAAFATLVALKVRFDSDCLSSFKSVKRRCDYLGEVNGARIFNDYAVHPTEISAVLNSLRTHFPAKRIVAVLQPHRYSRLADLFDEFLLSLNSAESIYVGEVFGAWEKPIEGISGLKLAQAGGHKYFSSYQNLKEMLISSICSQDIVVFLGAGSISKMAINFASGI